MGYGLIGLVAALLATACLGSRQLNANPRGGERVRVDGWSQRVEYIDYWASHRRVPAAWRHIVDWYTGSWPVIVAFSAGRACAFEFNVDTPDIVIGHELTCRWRTPR